MGEREWNDLPTYILTPCSAYENCLGPCSKHAMEFLLTFLYFAEQQRRHCMYQPRMSRSRSERSLSAAVHITERGFILLFIIGIGGSCCLCVAGEATKKLVFLF